jgi:hypothetical protein
MTCDWVTATSLRDLIVAGICWLDEQRYHLRCPDRDLGTIILPQPTDSHSAHLSVMNTFEVRARGRL